MLAIELFRSWGRCRPWSQPESGFHGAENRLWFRRLGDHAGNSAGARQHLRFTLMVVRRAKDNRGLRDDRVCTELPNQLISVHGWHEDIGDDQVGMLSSCD